MSRIHRFDYVSDYNDLNNHETLHPLISVIDFSRANPRSWGEEGTVRLHFGIYAIFLKQVKCGDLKYGRNYYDYQEGTLVFVAPGQVVDIESDGEVYQPSGHALVFHPDFLVGTPLAANMSRYSFFGYRSHEALHLSKRERGIVLDCLAKIQYELQQNVDKHSKKLIASTIDLFLGYSERFYDRQFITRDTVKLGILEKFEGLLNDYYATDKPREFGLPTVAYFAEELHLSANYFGDLIKKETGKTAQEYIQGKIIDLAKIKAFNPDKSVSEIAYELGFKYPQHFSRLFKQHVGQTPSAYRAG
ncbi:AraC-like DNA-binding protein [Lewinella aquimaris]|uniref:AraC-like DNA-binding protein n=1 Tax=Neolewinella aquimaris TaxID=1835722 RepID=A0A840EAF2_9BACT|nr:helix-turn-helix transcriptional regulator [Neolewinella aquimaris]MBB4080923.1 AraC-like DNA-binding protein [Neolewinella aquimaris]